MCIFANHLRPDTMKLFCLASGKSATHDDGDKLGSVTTVGILDSSSAPVCAQNGNGPASRHRINMAEMPSN